MSDLKKCMRGLRDELHEAAREFAKAEREGTAPKQVLLELQHRLDHLRQSIWDVRKLCDPYLVPYRREPSPGTTRTFAERIVNLVDARKQSA